MFFLLLLILPEVRTQVPALSNYSPRPYQPVFNAVQFVQHKQAKQGPILFPNDAPPPPPTPLIVTSRPLSESIARSELNPNNSLAAQSQYHQVTYRPNYLARGKNYEPYSYTLATVAPVFDYFNTAGTVQSRKENSYKDYETAGRKDFIESNSSEYLEYYPDSKHVRRRLFARIMNRDLQIRPLQSLYKNSNDIGNAWYRLSDHEKYHSDAEETDEIQHIIGLSTRRSVMLGVKYQGNDHKSKSIVKNEHNFGRNRIGQKATFYNSDRGVKPQHRPVKPQYEFNKIQRQQNTAPKVDPYIYKDSPEHFYKSKTNGDEHDYSNDNNHGENYAFSYTVKDHETGDDFSHSQKSTGSATNGEYRVLLPDGRMQIVSYTADENGYKADVRYDEHHKQDNSINLKNNKDTEFRNNYVPTTYKNKYGQNEHVVHQDSFESEEILHRPLNPIPTSFKTSLPNNYEQKYFENIHDYGNKNENIDYYNVYPTKSAYVDTTKANINDRTLDGLSDDNIDYLEHYNTHLEGKDKAEGAKVDFKFSDEVDFSKEIVDYSSELGQPYQPHKRKFSSLNNNPKTQAQAQVRPSYDELKDLFVTNANGRRNAALPVVSTVRPVYAVTPEHIVTITPKKPIHKLYTNIVSGTPTPFFFSTPSPSTPRSYLISTIANLKHQISLTNKPVLSDQYINKIKKYLTYTDPSKISK